MTPVEPSRIDANWRAIVIELDAPHPGVIERMMRSVGVPSEVTRIMAATPALRRSWFAAVFVVAVIGLLVAGAEQPRDSFFTLAVLAPLVPVVGIALAYGPSNDPAHEIELATPSKGLRLLLIRAATVQTVSTAVLASVSLLSPIPVLASLGWMLPSLGLTAATIALMAVAPPRRAASIAAVVWVALMLVASRGFDERLDVFGLAAQLAGVTVVVAGLVFVRWQRERFEYLRAGA